MIFVLNLQFVAFVGIKKRAEWLMLTAWGFYKNFLGKDFPQAALEKHHN
tara:strand:+ start:380 stop:526 length:147 start_codon:yes stop_codon:yes gene_type:complete